VSQLKEQGQYPVQKNPSGVLCSLLSLLAASLCIYCPILSGLYCT